MSDSYGDGWNGAEWSWTHVDGEVVSSATLATGSSDTVTICDDLTGWCATLSVSDGDYDYSCDDWVNDGYGSCATMESTCLCDCTCSTE